MASRLATSSNTAASLLVVVMPSTTLAPSEHGKAA